MFRRALRVTTFASAALTALALTSIPQPPDASAAENCATYGSYQVCGAIRAKYDSLGGLSSSLGAPRTNESAATGGFFNHFAGGSIYWSAATGAHVVKGSIFAKWAEYGWENSALGFPTTDETTITGGAFNHFAGGSIYWSPSSGAHLIKGDIRNKWEQLGWEKSSLGFPTTDETAVTGGAFNHFTNGSIYWSPSTNAVKIAGPIRDKWAALGYERSVLGFPASDDGANARGQYATFAQGAIMNSSQGGSRVLTGGVLATYIATGLQDSPLGFPVTDEASGYGGREQLFQSGGVTSLTSATTLPALITNFRSLGRDVRTIRVSHPNAEAGVATTTTASIDANSNEMIADYRAKYGTDPAAIGATWTNRSTASRLPSEIPPLPVVTPAPLKIPVGQDVTPAPTLSPTPSSTASPAPTQTAGPSLKDGSTRTLLAGTQENRTWAPNTWQMETKASRAGGAAFNMYFSWGVDEKGIQHNPRSVPIRNVVEYDISLYNNAHVDQGRPNCPTGTNQDFWAAKAERGSLVRSWTVITKTNGKVDAYFDGNDVLDSCRRQSFAVGIANPRDMQPQTVVNNRAFYDMYVSIVADRGTQASSPMAAGATAVVNNCPLFVTSSNCVALLPSYLFPFNGQERNLQMLNITRNLLAPNCWQVDYRYYSDVVVGCPAIGGS
jgi:hypothetical protein